MKTIFLAAVFMAHQTDFKTAINKLSSDPSSNRGPALMWGILSDCFGKAKPERVLQV